MLTLAFWLVERSVRSMSTGSALWLTLRSLLWTLLLPGFVAGYVPWMYFGLKDVSLTPITPLVALGMMCSALGIILLFACIFEFARTGRGTLSPVDPPRHLVVRGLYKYVRNPMYLSVTCILLGEVILTQSRALFAYWLFWLLAVNVFVIAYEEPTLRRQFGNSYEDYKRSVGRWVPRFHHTGKI